MSVLFSTFICWLPFFFSFFFFTWCFLVCLFSLLRKTLFAWFFYCFAELNHSVLWFERNTGFKINLFFTVSAFVCCACSFWRTHFLLFWFVGCITSCPFITFLSRIQCFSSIIRKCPLPQKKRVDNRLPSSYPAIHYPRRSRLEVEKRITGRDFTVLFWFGPRSGRDSVRPSSATFPPQLKQQCPVASATPKKSILWGAQSYFPSSSISFSSSFFFSFFLCLSYQYYSQLDSTFTSYSMIGWQNRVCPI